MFYLERGISKREAGLISGFFYVETRKIKKYFYLDIHVLKDYVCSMKNYVSTKISKSARDRLKKVLIGSDIYIYEFLTKLILTLPEKTLTKTLREMSKRNLKQ